MPNGAPETLADQELIMVAIVLQARGWVVTDRRNDGGRLTIIATRTVAPEPVSAEQFKARG